MTAVIKHNRMALPACLLCCSSEHGRHKGGVCAACTHAFQAAHMGINCSRQPISRLHTPNKAIRDREQRTKSLQTSDLKLSLTIHLSLHPSPHSALPSTPLPLNNLASPPLPYPPLPPPIQTRPSLTACATGAHAISLQGHRSLWHLAAANTATQDANACTRDKGILFLIKPLGCQDRSRCLLMAGLMSNEIRKDGGG